MKSIELTEGQQLELLQLSRDNFDEFDIRFANFDKSFLIVKNLSNQETHKIHWFEFCILYLSNKIFEKDSISMQKMLNNTIVFNNPLDYLITYSNNKNNEKV
jgi:hypothetical protein